MEKYNSEIVLCNIISIMATRPEADSGFGSGGGGGTLVGPNLLT